MFARFVFLLAFLLAISQVFAGLIRMEPSVNTFSSAKWVQDRKLSDTDFVRAVFVLKHNPENVRKFEAELLDISNPKSKNYGNWLKAEEIKAKMAPSEQQVKKVTDYLTAHGLTSMNYRVSKNQDMIHVTMPSKIASNVLNTEFAYFRSTIKEHVMLPRITKPYHLPEDIAEVVSIVDDIMRFPAVREPMLKADLETRAGTDPEFNSCGSSCAGNTTPDVLKKAYSFGAVKSVAPGNSMSVAEFQMQYYDNADLKAFSNACQVTSTVDTTIGGNNERICQAGGCVEALLDIEYIEAVANPIPLTVIYLSTYSLLDWVDQVISMDNPPLVHSVSYGNDEIQQTSVEYMQSVNEQFMMAGSLGLSILFASGDQGVWGRSGVGKTYNPDFPAASPYVTAVGGTNFKTKSVIGEESAWSCGGGGFSDTFSRPSWQSEVVESYLSLAKAQGVLPDATLFNSTGRAYPDVAALGGQTNPYCISYMGGSKFTGVAGTSASCPVVAGIFAQLNNLRLANGKAPMGFLNPFIYSNSACFNDVNDGSMNNCNKGTTGFAALNGWDPATGFGSPNFECLSKAV